MRQNKLNITLLSLFFIFASCSKEEFTATKVVQTESVPVVSTTETSSCASFTILKPKVDFLFLWDNSTSMNYATEDVKTALNNTITKISTRFDYRVVIAPIKTSTSDPWENASLVAENPDGLDSFGKSISISKESAVARLESLPQVSGSIERGFSRAKSLLNKTHGIFRDQAYTIVVIMSNGDDCNGFNAYTKGRAYCENYAITEAQSMITTVGQNFSGNQQFRFMSLVPYSACQTVAGNVYANFAYKMASSKIYQNAGSPVMGSGGLSDSFNICGADFSYILDGVNNSIMDVQVNHVYNYWPILETSSPRSPVPFNENEISVYKITGSHKQELYKGDTNGYEYVGFLTNQNTRKIPGPSMPTSGYFIKLQGLGELTYPSCLMVKTKSPLEYYGYIQLPSEPIEDTIKLTINGVIIPKSSINGWSFLPGYKTSQNIKVIGIGNDSPATPAVNKSGYFLKLHGNAIYSNGADIKFEYMPAPI